MAYDGNRRILNDAEIRSLFPGSGSYSAGATPSRPLSINHLLGPSFIEGARELFLRCSTLATAADIKGPLRQDIVAKMIIDKGIGNIMQTRTDEGHYVRLHGPITLRTLSSGATSRRCCGSSTRCTRPTTSIPSLEGATSSSWRRKVFSFRRTVSEHS